MGWELKRLDKYECGNLCSANTVTNCLLQKISSKLSVIQMVKRSLSPRA